MRALLVVFCMCGYLFSTSASATLAGRWQQRMSTAKNSVEKFFQKSSHWHKVGKSKLGRTVVQSALVAGLALAQQPVVADQSRVVGQHSSWGFMVGEGPISNTAGIFLDGNYSDDPRLPEQAHDIAIVVQMRVLGMQGGGFEGLSFGDFAGSGKPFKFTGDKVAPLIFGRLGGWTHDHEFLYDDVVLWGGYYEDRLIERSFLQGIFGGGLEFVDDPWQRGKFARIQLRAGFGGIAHSEVRVVSLDRESNGHTFSPESPASKAERERLDSTSGGQGDWVGMLEATVKVDRTTAGDLLDRASDSYWHLLPVIPHGEITASAYQPLFVDAGDDALIYRLTGQAQVVGNFYLNFEHVDSPNFYQPHQRIGVRLNFFPPF